MAGAGLVLQAIVLAFGAGALGGVEALRLLRQFSGRSAVIDLATCVIVISLLTAPLLGIMLLACFVRKGRAGGTGAPAMDVFAQVTATVSVGAAFLVTACLVLVPGGSLGAARIPVDFAVVRNPVVITVLAICAAFAVAAVYLRARLFRVARSVGGPAAAVPATKIKVVVFVVVMSSIVASFVASGGFDAHAQLLVPEFIWSMVTLPVAVAVATVAGTMLLVRCSRWARNTAGAGGGAGGGAAAARTS